MLSFEMNNDKDVFMVTIEKVLGEEGGNDSLSIFVENCKFESKSFNITEDEEGYIPVIPQKNIDAKNNFKIIKSESYEDTVIPDILPVKFLLPYNNENFNVLPHEITKYYTVVDLELVEICVYDEYIATDDLSQEESESENFVIRQTETRNLIQLEPLIFIQEPYARINDQLQFDVDIKAYYFDVAEMSFTSMSFSPSDNSPYLEYYEGYRIMSIADEVASIFSTNSSPIKTTCETYIVTNKDSNTEEYYYVVEDERFSTLEELREYTLGYFSEDITDTFFKSSDLYLEIEGKLCKKMFNLFSGGAPEKVKIINGCNFENDSDVYFSENSTANFFVKTDSYDKNGVLITEDSADNFEVTFTENSAQGFIITKYN